MKKILLALALAPLVAAAQGAQQQAQQPQQQGGPGMGRGQGRGMMGMNHGDHGDPAKMERRARLARTLGLAEALDLEPAQALKLGEQIAKFDDKRLALHKQLRDAHETLRRAASGEKVTAADVDGAIQRALDARTQMQALDREVIGTISKDLSPEKRARAVLFLERFQRRFGHGPGREVQLERRRMRGPGAGPGGMGMELRHGPGPMMGMGAMGPGPCDGPDCPFDDEPGDDDED